MQLSGRGFDPSTKKDKKKREKANQSLLEDIKDQTNFFFLVVLGFELRAYTLSDSTSPFLCWVFFEIDS
jgi:hypothetical protein